MAPSGEKKKKELWMHSLTNIIDLFCKTLVITRDFYFKICLKEFFSFVLERLNFKFLLKWVM